MNFFGYLLIVLGVAFFAFELVGLIRDIIKRNKKKKEIKVNDNETNNS